MLRITHPHPQAGRQTVFGIVFVDGVATVEDLHQERALALTQHGHVIEDIPDGTPFLDLTVRELRELAQIEGIDVPKGAKKSEIVSAFLRAQMEEG